MDSLDELRRLRARAYGPAADIHDDAAALRRLRELEALHDEREPARADAATPVPARTPLRDASPSPSPSANVQAPPALPSPRTETAASTATTTHVTPPATTDTETDSGDQSRQRVHLKRSTRILWALSVVAAATAAAAVTFAVVYIAPVSTSHGAPQIATLTPSTTTNIPSGWFGAGPSSMAFEFYGLTLYESTGGFGMAAGNECFTAVATDDLPDPDTENEMNNWSIQSAIYSGCRVGAFPAMISVPVNSGAPQELRDQFPANSALQFVLDGNRVGVFLDAG